MLCLGRAVSPTSAATPRHQPPPLLPAWPTPAVAWLLEDQQQAVEEALRDPEVAAAAAALAAQPWQLRPAAIVCKAGQREHAVWQAAADKPP